MGQCVNRAAENNAPKKDNPGDEVEITKPNNSHHEKDDKCEDNDDQPADKAAIPANLRRKVEVKKQRRRLSVAPQHVGDIQKSIAATKDRRFSTVSSDHIPTKEEPKKFVAISKKGYVPYNKNKVNQDTYFCDYKFAGNPDVRLFGVCDGHGEFGHNVSGLIARKLPKYLQKENYLENPHEAIKNCVLKVSDTLRKSSINTTFSGSTLVFSLMIKDKIYTANCGDSRSVIAFKTDDGTLNTKALSYDHKPELPEEHQRIIESGGRVAPLPGPPGEDPGPNRVWLADIDVPGLAMSRSLGDDVAHSVGVSSIPEITEYTITDKDEFLMYGSDGIWEFIPNQEAASIVCQYLPDLREAALKLVKHAITKWREEEEVIDDITAVIFNLKDTNNENTETGTDLQQDDKQSQQQQDNQHVEQNDQNVEQDEPDQNPVGAES